MAKRKITGKAKQATQWPLHALARASVLGLGLASLGAQSAAAQSREGLVLFQNNCFSPFLTATRAADRFAAPGVRWDFYDLAPFSTVPMSPATGRPATPGTDRRCEVSFDGAATDKAQAWVLRGVEQEGLQDRLIAVPADFPLLPTTRHAAAVQLNPDRIAVTQVGKRAGPNGTETYMSVERLVPLSEAQK